MSGRDQNLISLIIPDKRIKVGLCPHGIMSVGFSLLKCENVRKHLVTQKALSIIEQKEFFIHKKALLVWYIAVCLPPLKKVALSV